MIKNGLGCDEFFNYFPEGKFQHLWRGFKNRNFHGTIMLPPVCERPPRDNSLMVHKIADQWFYDNFGVKYRSEALFCTGDKAVAGNYGNIYPVAPVDGFRFCWSRKIKDLFSEVSSKNIDPTDSTSIIHLLNDGEYMGHDLFSAVLSGSEIMVNASGYVVMAD